LPFMYVPFDATSQHLSQPPDVRWVERIHIRQCMRHLHFWLGCATWKFCLLTFFCGSAALRFGIADSQRQGSALAVAATMSSIATRAGASIGSLYQFFPNKVAVVQALRRHYCDEFELTWAPLVSKAKHLSWEGLVVRLVDSTVLFAERHPAFLALLDAPARTHAPAAVRERFQQLVATTLLARRPHMSPEKALRIATMTLQMIKAMNFLYRDLSPQERRPYVREFKILLQCYLLCRIEHPIKRQGNGCKTTEG
jgi:AcrR family transcriptional regulator